MTPYWNKETGNPLNLLRFENQEQLDAWLLEGVGDQGKIHGDYWTDQEPGPDDNWVEGTGWVTDTAKSDERARLQGFKNWLRNNQQAIKDYDLGPLEGIEAGDITDLASARQAILLLIGIVSKLVRVNKGVLLLLEDAINRED